MTHGRRACYMNGCQLPECVAAHTRYCKEYELRTASRTRGLLVDAGPYRERLQRYRDADWSLTRIATACGLSAAAVLGILGGQAHILAATADAIDALTPVPDPRPHVPSLGSVRRLRALVAALHPVHGIVTASGLGGSTVRKLLHHPRPTIYVPTADGAHRAYQALADKTGTSARSGRLAAANGWLPPWAWHDDDLDTPDAEPVLGKHAAAREKAAEVRHLASFGISPEEIAERTGQSVKYVRGQLDGSRAPGWRERQAAAS